jgi:hypothetical protein
MNVPQPLAVVTQSGAAGAAYLAGLLLAIAVAAFFYMRAVQRAQAPLLGATLLITAVALAIAFCAPVLFSSDVYAYAAYGQMARIGIDPYAHVPAGTMDPLVRAAQVQWVTAFPICLYGPAFVAAARFLVTAFAPFGALAQLDAFRVAACVGLLLCAALAYRAFPGDGRERSRAAATIGLNPVAIWCAAEGHNDAIALAVVLAGFALLQCRLAGIGSALVGLSALLKPPGIAAAIALAIAQRRARIGAIAGVVAASALSIPLLRGVATQLAPHGTYAPQASLQAIVAPLGPAAAGLFAVAVAGAVAWGGIGLLRAQRDEGWIVLGIAAWVLIPNPYPWYGLWLVALAALAPHSRAGRTAILLSLTASLRYVPDAIGNPGPALGVLLGVLAALPLLVLCYNRRPA